MKLNKLNRHISIMLIWLVMTLPFASAQATSPPTVAISNAQLNHGAQTVITWQTNVLANGYVEWGNTSALGTNTTTPQGTLHTATLNTVAGQTYYYRIVSCETTCTSTQTDSFTAGSLFITTSLAPYVRTANIDIPGRTRAGAKVDLYVNSVMVRSQNTSTEAFVFRGVQLQPVNNVTLRAFYNNEQAEKSFTLRVDSEPPRITVDMPRIATQPSVVARVTTTEPVNISVTTRRVDASPPGRPTALTLQGSTNSRIELSWTNASGATEYLVQRDGIVIAKTTTNTYADTTVGADRQYDYEIIAVNAACMQSEPSATLAVTTPGGTNTQGPVVEVKASCERDAQSYLVTSTADITVNLVEGENLVTFTATDAAGFESIIEESVIYDLAPPQFLEQNLASLTPSYSPQVVVRGKLSEKGSVTVFINDRAAETKKTEDDGSFTIPVLLERNIQVKTDVLAAGLDTGVGYGNKMQLEATDAVGQKTRTEQVDVVYSICGFGTDFDVKIANPVPDVLNPRLMHEGLQQLGIAFTYEYKGGNNAVVAPGAVTVRPVTLAPAIAKEYDNSLVTINSQTQGKRGKQNAGEGYVQVTFTPITDPWTQFGEGKKPNNPTLYDIEDAIASHRMAYKDLKIKECKTPAVGCYRLFMKLEIPYQTSTQSQQYLPEQPLTGQAQPQNKVQQTCIDVEVAIDRRIDPAHLPQGFLKGMSETLGAIIEGVDTVLKPLRTIYQYLFYTCLAGMIVIYVPTFLEQYNCKYQNLASAVSGEGKFDEGVAAINACKTEYGGQQKSLDNCEACATWKKNKKWVEDVYKQICDRVSCPSAPSLQHYIKSRANQQLTVINAPKAKAELTQYTSKTDGNLYQGSDCAAWAKWGGKSVTFETESTSISVPFGSMNVPTKFSLKETNVPPSSLFTSNEIEGIYNNWLARKSDKRTDDVQPGGEVNCAAPHPATPECCGYEYMNEWGSACGIGGTLVGQGIDTFDEIKESTCLAAEKANKKTIGTGDKAVSCGGITNALAGFCTAEGTEPLDYVRVTTFSGSQTENTGKLAELGIGKSSDQYLYILLIPSKGAASNYDIKLGYIVEEAEFSQTKESKEVKEENNLEVNNKMRAIGMDSPAISEYFKQQNADNYYAGKLNADVYNKFQATLCEAAGKKTGCDINGKTIYDSVMSKIGKPDQEYIIDPRKGIINAIRCICLPAVISYLQLWRNIMVAVKNCVDTIRFTGDGNPGTCQEVISKYACDLIYEALACFTEKFSAGGGRQGGRDLFGALTSAGTEMSNSIQGRYGQNSMYNTVFSQGQIVKSVCAFAFTGTWSMDFAALADQSIDDFPIESQSFLYPCDRRFVSFNPLTTPAGMTTWIYHFGVFIAPGSDIDIEFALKCSGGYKCSENDGFERGKCDCDTEKTLTIAPTDLPTRASKGEIVDSAVYYTVAGNPGGTIRYDKAVLTYKWKDAQGKEQRKPLECRINQLGGAPNFCRFDMFSGAYRCQFGPEQGGIQLATPEVSYPHNVSSTAGSTPIGVFTLNDKLNINVPIRQAYTGQVSETKFLQWEITGPGGALVADNNNSITKLDTNGDYIKNIGSSTFDPQVIVQQNWFGATAAPSAAGAPVMAEIWSKRTGIQTFSSIISSATLMKGTSTSTERKQFVVTFTKQAGVNYAIYGAGNKQTQENKFTKGNVIQGCTGTYSTGPINCQIGDTRLTLNVQSSALPTESGEYYEVHLSFNEQATSTGDFCSGENKYKPVTFTVNIKAYDANELGQISDMIAINPTTNEEARTTTTFNAVCVGAEDQKFKDMEKLAAGQTPAIAAGQKWILLKQQFDKMYAQEETYLTQLEDLRQNAKTDQNKFLIEVQTKLPTIIDSIIAYETTEFTKLAQLIETPVTDQSVAPSEVFALLANPGTGAPSPFTSAIEKLTTIKTELQTIPSQDAIKYYSERVSKTMAVLSQLQPKKTLAINSLNKNLGITVCQEGYKNDVVTSCLTTAPDLTIWKKAEGITCADSRAHCYTAPVTTLYVDGKIVDEKINPIPPGKKPLLLKVAVLKADRFQGLAFDGNWKPVNFTDKGYLNNVYEFTSEYDFVNNTSIGVLVDIPGVEGIQGGFFDIPVQKKIDAAAGEISSLLAIGIRTQAVAGNQWNKYAALTDAQYENSAKRGEIKNATRLAIATYTQLQTDFGKLNLAQSAQIYLSTVNADLSSVIGALNQLESALSQSIPPPEQSWSNYLKSQLQGTGNTIPNLIGKTFADSLALYDNINPRTFSVNNELVSVTVPSRADLNFGPSSPITKHVCAYYVDKHYFSPIKCWVDFKTVPFVNYLNSLPYGTYEFRRVTQIGTPLSWTNGVKVTIEEPKSTEGTPGLYIYGTGSSNSYPHTYLNGQVFFVYPQKSAVDSKFYQLFSHYNGGVTMPISENVVDKTISYQGGTIPSSFFMTTLYYAWFTPPAGAQNIQFCVFNLDENGARTTLHSCSGANLNILSGKAFSPIFQNIFTVGKKYEGEFIYRLQNADKKSNRLFLEIIG